MSKEADRDPRQDSQTTIASHDVHMPQFNKSEISPDKETTTSSSQPTENKIPDGGYGWMVVLGVFLINFHVWGVNSTFGIFLAYYLQNDYFPGVTHLQLALVAGLSFGMAYIVAPLTSLTNHHFGTTVTLAIGLVLETLGLITAGSASQTWQLFLSFSVAFGMGMGFLFIGSLGIVPQWFDKHRSLANGTCAAGSGLGALTYNLATQAIIQRYGVPWAFRVLGICTFASNLFSVVVVKDRNKQVGAKTGTIIDTALLKKWEYLCILGWGIFSLLGYVVLLFTLPSYATSIGLSPRQGSLASAILNLGQAIGRPPVGYFSDRLGRINMAAFTTFLTGVFVLAVWIPTKSFGVLILFALLGGSVMGSIFATLPPVIAEVVGLPSIPSAISMFWLFLVIPSTFSEAMALEIADSTSSGYLGTQIFTAMMYVCASACLIPVRAWKITENMKEKSEKAELVDMEQEAIDGDLKDGKNIHLWRAALLWRRA